MTDILFGMMFEKLKTRVAANEQRQRREYRLLKERVDDMALNITQALEDGNAAKTALANIVTTLRRIDQDEANILARNQAQAAEITTLSNRVDMLEQALADMQASPEIMQMLAYIRSSAEAIQATVTTTDASIPDDTAPDVPGSQKPDTHS